VAAHLEQATTAHLLLALSVISDQEHTLKQLIGRVAELETKAEAHGVSCTDMQTGALAAAAIAAQQGSALAAHEAKLHSLEKAHVSAAKGLADVGKAAKAADQRAAGLEKEVIKAGAAHRAAAQASQETALAIRQLQAAVGPLTPNPDQTQKQWKKV
jgi:hypothetical protein